MKEKLYIIPMMDALREFDECPFCVIERDLEQHALDFVLGSSASYMQEDIRLKTDELGFCREHFKKMFEYGNRLGSTFIVDTHLQRLLREFRKEMKKFSGIDKAGFGQKLSKGYEGVCDSNSLSKWIHKNEDTCYICNHIKENFDRYIATFFELFRTNNFEFMTLLKEGKGVCLSHLATLLDRAPLYLNKKQQDELRAILLPQMETNMERIVEELDWLEFKFDYRYKDADWKNSKDALERAMQKIAGGYPADPPYRQK